MPLRRTWWSLLVFAQLLAALCVRGAAGTHGPMVELAPAETFVYAGCVGLTTPGLTREGATFTSSYAVTVTPFAFWNECGRLTIAADDDTMRRLERGESAELHGQAISTAGKTRRIEAVATPESPTRGRLRLRVYVTKRIRLTFNTTYRLVAAP